MNNSNSHYLLYLHSGLISIEACKKLSTPRLLAYYKKKRGMRYIGMCDCGCNSIPEENEERNRQANEYMDAIKEILDKREHVEK